MSVAGPAGPAAQAAWSTEPSRDMRTPNLIVIGVLIRVTAQSTGDAHPWRRLVPSMGSMASMVSMVSRVARVPAIF